MVDTVLDTTASTASVTVGSNVTVVVDTSGDRDWYRVNLVAGTTYYFSLGATGAGDIFDSVLFLRDTVGNYVTVNDDTSATNFYSAFSYTATSTGVFFLDAGAFGPETGNIRLAVSSFSIGADTVFASTTTTSSVAVGGSVNGVINTTTDHDWYSVSLVAGQTYTFSTSATATNSIGDTVLSLRDGIGTVLSSNDDLSESVYYSSITFTATTTGTHYLDVSGLTPNVGNFQLSVVSSAPPPTDLVPGDTSSTVALAVGADVDGALNTVGDHDWYRVTLTAGQTYIFQTGATGTGDVSDTTLSLRDASGLEIAFNYDSGSGYSAIVFTATASGTYFLDVGAFNDASAGNFNVSAATYVLPPLYTNNQIAAQLATDFWVAAGDEAHHFNVTSGGTITVNVTGLTTDGQFLAREAFNLWHDATGINFVEVVSGAQIVVDDTDPDGAYATAVYSGGITTSAAVNVSVGWITTNGNTLNSYSFQTFVHEIGHALGLGHAGNYNGNASFVTDALYRNDAWATTIMSYFSQTENPYFAALGFTQNFVLSPMVADGIAVTTMYGVASGIRTGATVYGFGNTSGRAIYDAVANPLVAYTVFDNGGVDTLNYSGYSQSQRINLNVETFSNIGGGVGNVSIARGTLIENANGGSGADVMIGNAAANVLNGNAGNDNIDGGSGNDSINGGLGADTLIGGVGIDTLVYTGSTAGVSVNLTTNAASGGAAGDVISLFENVTGSALNDNITGSAADNTILGAAGADTLNGGVGNDTLSYAGSNVAVQIDLAANTAAGGHAAGDVISLFENIIGSSFNDALGGSALANTILGGLGNDTITGLAGNDVLTGETGTDSISGGDGNDTILGGINGDAMDGGLGTDLLSYVGSTAVVVNLTTNTVSGGHATGDTITGFENVLGSAYADNITGNALANTITGGAGADTLNGSTGLDTLSYEGSNAGVTVNLTTNTASGGHAAGDVISNFEYLLGSSFSDTLTGSAVTNFLTGGSGNDTLDGAAGNDTLRGGVGADQATGGLGADTFGWDDGEFGTMTTTGADRIVDFSAAQLDKINLSLVDANTTTATVDNAFAFIGTSAFSNVAGQLRYEVQGTNTIVMGDQNGDGAADFWIRLDGVVALAAGNFVL